MKGRPIIPWMGGKRRLAKHILPAFPEHKTYVEVFAGGAALFFKKEVSNVEVLNDANGDLTNLYRVVKHHLDEFVSHFRWALISRQDFLMAQKTPPQVLTDIQRAARFYFLQRNAFGARPTGQTFGTAALTPPKMNLLRIEEELSAAHVRLARVYIEDLDWTECIKRYDRSETLFYLDPPYYGTAGYGGEFGLDQYSVMAELARTVKGKMLISVNDCPAMRRAFRQLQKERLSINYTVGGNGRGRNRGELLIRNF